MSPMTTTAQARILTNAAPGEFVAFVALPGAPEVRVRFRHRDVGNQWVCDDCGPHRFSTCPHEVAARRTYQTEQRREIR